VRSAATADTVDETPAQATAVSGDEGQAAVVGEGGADAPATAIEDVSWSSEGPATVVTITAGSAFAPDQIRQSRLQSPPRVLVRIMGITEAFRIPGVRCQLPQLTGVRFGHHHELDPPQLHVVLDLADPDVEVTEMTIDGRSAALRLVLADEF
jgi:hypothetical protein